MTTIVPKAGSGYFHWNTGGWFGAQFGCTAWLVVGAGVLASGAPEVAAIWLIGFVVANVVGTLLWQRRDRLRPHPAIQVQLLVSGLCGLAAFMSLDVLRPDALARFDSGGPTYSALLIVPVLMAWFAVLEHFSKVRSQAPDHL